MTTDLHTIGEALFGQQWQRPLARALGLHERTVRVWVASGAVPENRWPEIAKLCRSRGAALTKLADQLSA